MKKKNAETASTEVLTWREAVRKRPAMYTGSTAIYGFTNILKEFFSSTYKFLDPNEFSFKHSLNILEAEKISFEILGKQSGVFRFEKPNRKIPANLNEELHSAGFDFAVLNALSLDYEFRLFDEKRNLILEQIYRQGILQSGTVAETEYSFDVMEIKFDLDTAIWQDFELNPHFIADIIKELAFLNPDKTFELSYPFKGETSRIIYQFPNGLKDLVSLKGFRGLGSTIFETGLEFKSEDFSADICFSFRKYGIDKPFLKSFVNNIYTHQNGTHVKAVLSGIAKALKKFVKEHKPNDFFVITDRTILSCLLGAVHLKMKRPRFYGSTRNRLDNREIIQPISDYVFKKFYPKLDPESQDAKDLICHFYDSHWNRKWLKRI